MTQKKKYIISLMIAGCFAGLSAQEATVLVRDKQVRHIGDALQVEMKFVLDSVEITRGNSLVCTPLIEEGDSLRALPSLIINGRDRQILYERMERENENEIAVRRLEGKQSVPYKASIPYADWMEQSKVSLVIDDCGCGWEALSQNRSPLFDIDLAPVVLAPAMVYLTPEAEVVKARKMEGSAFLDFPVNKITIYPEYRKNPEELKKIAQTIDAVRNNKFATITRLSIKGYASPEGGYKNNAYLAENRAKALLEYVKGLYDFGDIRMDIDFEPEDWTGLEKAIEAGNLPDKAELLAIIRADEPADWDAREWKLKQLNGGTSYAILLRDVYPGLRHSDYEVDYTIRHFTVEEAKELVFTDPSQLSLNEMFLVAQTYKPGSKEYNEVFETAVRLYPDDPVSNLNAAITAINTRQLDKARTYLAKAKDCPEKQLAEASLRMLTGDLDGAESILKDLQNEPSVGVQAKDNLEQTQKKREKDKMLKNNE